jgi:hypothetical protein
MSRAFSNIDSTKSQVLKHCFKNVERPDFFNTLSQEQTLALPGEVKRLSQTSPREKLIKTAPV